MANIDDLAELIVEELNDFKVEVNKMEQISKNLKTINISPDLKEMESLLSIHLKQQKELSTAQSKELSELTRKLSKTNHYPNWLIALLGTLVLCFLLLSSYTIYELKAASETNEEYYNKGQTKVFTYFKEFLQDNKEASEAYQKWKESKTK